MEIGKNSYKLYYEREYIADFIEIYTDFGIELKIKDSCDLSKFEFADLNALQKDRVIDTEGVEYWIDERCTPATQDGIEEKLKIWGLSEYNQLDIMHRSSAITFSDRYWIAFNPKATFDENHPRGNNFKYILGD